MSPFIPGLELSRHFYWEAVRPTLDKLYPNLVHASALLGYGSEVLGFDDEMSTDHNWYPMMLLFLKEEDARLGEEIKEALRYHLPDEILGYPINCEPDPNDAGTFYMKLTREKPINHSVFTLTVREFIQNYLGYDINHPLEVADWLTFPSQKLLEVTAGGVHYDGFDELTAIRQKLNYYPQDVWLYLLVAAWQRISDLEGLMQRTGIAGDELGSINIAEPEAELIIATARLRLFKFRPFTKTWAPDIASALAISRPNPWGASSNQSSFPVQ